MCLAQAYYEDIILESETNIDLKNGYLDVKEMAKVITESWCFHSRQGIGQAPSIKKLLLIKLSCVQ